MKLIILAILLPCVLSECPSLSETAVECHGADIMCHVPPGPDGCPMDPRCMYVDPYASCSNRAFCPTVCPDDYRSCPSSYEGMDEDGCPTPEDCAPMDSSTADCPSFCPVFCGPNEMECDGGLDASGCQRRNVCAPMDSGSSACPSLGCPVFCGPNSWNCDGGHGGVDASGCPISEVCATINSGPDDPCPSLGCPVFCGPNETKCPGAVDPNGCPNPEMCAPTPTPVSCAHNEVMCYGGQDPNGCPMWDSCEPFDHTAICQPVCPLSGGTCPVSEVPCHGGEDSNGCRMPDVCSANGKYFYFCFTSI